MSHNKCKQSLYFPEDMLEEIKQEANRQDRSLSWIVQKAWERSKGVVAQFPSVDEELGRSERYPASPPTTK